MELDIKYKSIERKQYFDLSRLCFGWNYAWRTYGFKKERSFKESFAMLSYSYILIMGVLCVTLSFMQNMKYLQITQDKCIHFCLNLTKCIISVKRILKQLIGCLLVEECTKVWMFQFSNKSIIYDLTIWRKPLNRPHKVEWVQEIISLNFKFIFDKQAWARKVFYISVPQFETNYHQIQWKKLLV